MLGEKHATRFQARARMQTLSLISCCACARLVRSGLLLAVCEKNGGGGVVWRPLNRRQPSVPSALSAPLVSFNATQFSSLQQLLRGLGACWLVVPIRNKQNRKTGCEEYSYGCSLRNLNSSTSCSTDHRVPISCSDSGQITLL